MVQHGRISQTGTVKAGTDLQKSVMPKANRDGTLLPSHRTWKTRMWGSRAGLLIPAVGIRALTHHATDKPLPPDAQRNGACVREFRAVVKVALPNCVMVAVGG